MLFTIIRHDIRKALGLDITEYVVLDIVSQMCRNVSMAGWCVVDKRAISDIIDCGDAMTGNILNKLKSFGFIEENEAIKMMRVTDKYLSIVNSGVIQPQQEEPPQGKQQTQEDLKPNQVDATDKREYTEEEKERFLNFNKWCAINAPRVLKMKEQMTIGEFYRIREKIGVDSLMVKLKQMHNWEPLLKTNRNVYMTICNWVNREN